MLLQDNAPEDSLQSVPDLPFSFSTFTEILPCIPSSLLFMGAALVCYLHA